MLDSVAKRRIGVLGGTFDPPHFGHLTAAAQVADLLHLEQVWFVPTGDSWQKSGVTAASSRAELARLAIQDNPRFRLELLEVNRSGPTYTVDTLRELRSAHPDCEFFFILGVDAALGLDTWREFDEIPSLAELVVVNRPGVASDQLDALRGKPFFSKLRMLNIDGVEVSSTEVRNRVAQGLAIDTLVPQSVQRYISEYSLYRSFNAKNPSEHMSEQLPFKSRREMREAERSGLIEAQELPFDADPRVAEAKPVPVESTGQPLTRRQLRELEKTGGILAVHTSQVELPNLPAEPASWASEPEVAEVSQNIAPVYEPVLAEREEPVTTSNQIWSPEPQATFEAQTGLDSQAEVESQAVAEPQAEPSQSTSEQVPMAPISAPEESPADREAVLNAAREFDALFDRIGEVQKPKANVKRILIWVTAILALAVGGLLIAANVMGILK